jgi:DNA-binding MarR family transcriptional regulator
MSPTVSDLTDHLGYWLRLVSNNVSFSFTRKLATKGVTVAEWAMMRVLYGEEPVAPSSLAERMGQTRGAVSKLADRLVAKGLVARERGLLDRRTQILRLTARGEVLVPGLAAAADENDREWFGGLSDSERHALERLLKDMVARLGLKSMAID